MGNKIPYFLRDGSTIEFRAPSLWYSPSFDLAPEEAVKFFKAKGLKPTWNWWEMQAEQHTSAFTVAKMMDTDLLKSVQDSVDYALDSGLGTEWMDENLIPEMKAKGWWGKTANGVQLGSPARLQTIYRTNMQSAYAVGQWDAIQEAKEVMPYLMYDAVDDFRTRPEHAAMDEIVRPVDDGFWSSHYPPNGFNCRCSVIQLSAEDLKEYGLKQTPMSAIMKPGKEWYNPMTGKKEWIPVGVDPGFNYNPGKSYAQHLGKIYKQKTGAMGKAQQAALAKAPSVPSAEDIAIVAAKAKAQAEAAEQAIKAQAVLEDIFLNPAGQTLKHKALQALKKQGALKKGYDPVTILGKVTSDAAKAQAKASQSAALSGYKKNIIAGKTPTPSQIKAYNALEDTQKAKFLINVDNIVQAELKTKAIVQANNEAAEYFTMLLDGDMPDPGKWKIKAFKKLKQIPGWENGSVADQWAAVSGHALQLKAKNTLAGQLSTYKKSILAGKKPTPAIQKAYDSLDDQAKKAFNAKIDLAAHKVKPGAKKTTFIPGTATKAAPKKYKFAVEDIGDQAQIDELHALAGTNITKVDSVFQKGFNNGDEFKKAMDDVGLDQNAVSEVQDFLVEHDIIDAYTWFDEVIVSPQIIDDVLAQADELIFKYPKGLGTIEAKHHMDDLVDSIGDGAKMKKLDTLMKEGFEDGDDFAKKMKKAGFTKNEAGDVQDVFITEDLIDYDGWFEAASKKAGTFVDDVVIATQDNIDEVDDIIKGITATTKATKKASTAKGKIKIDYELLDIDDGAGFDILDALVGEYGLDHQVASEAYDNIIDILVNKGIKNSADLKKQLKALKIGKVFDELDKIIVDQANVDLAKYASPKSMALLKKQKAQTIISVKPVPKTAPTKAPVFDDLTQTGPQKGSNPGGKFKDPETGQEYYIKLPASEDYARNEQLTAKLYDLAGVEAPEIYLIDINSPTLGTGKGIASKIIDGLSENKTKLQTGKVSTATDGFITDAWLANHDVVGAGFDNLLMKGSKAVRIDTGGGLRYRAMGNKKGIWGKEVPQIDDMRNIGTNANSASVFGKMSNKQLENSATKVLAVADDDIRRAVKEFGPLDAAENKALADTLIARKATIKMRFPKAKITRPAAVKDANKAITATEHATIKQARGNGYVRPTDGGEIEDQAILMYQQRNPSGGWETVADFKTHGAGTEKLRKAMGVKQPALKSAPAEPLWLEMESLEIKMKEAIIGVKHRALNSQMIDPKDIIRVRKLDNQIEEISDQMDILIDAKKMTMAQKKRVMTHYTPWFKDLQKAVKAGEGKAFNLHGTVVLKGGKQYTKATKPTLKAIKVTAEPGAQYKATWKLHETNLAVNKNGHIRRIDQKGRKGLTHEVYEVEIDDVLVRYYTGGQNGGELLYAMKDKVEVIAKGATKATSEKIYNAMKKLGIDTRRPDALDVEEKYLMQIFYHRRDNYNAVSLKAKSYTDQKSRVRYLRKQLENDTGVGIDDMANYKPFGEHQAFDHGRMHTFRPDLDTPDWRKFESEYRIYHQDYESDLAVSVDRILSSGGSMAPTTDKIRRGIDLFGASPVPDLGTGGASYFFTRIKPIAQAREYKGYVWKTRQLKRTDTISFDFDNYGDVRDGKVMRLRKTGVDEWKKAAERGGNETVFKNSLSLFDDLENIIAVDIGEKQRIIAVIRKHGYKKWPDGRKLEDVVRVRGI